MIRVVVVVVAAGVGGGAVAVAVAVARQQASGCVGPTPDVSMPRPSGLVAR
ncbi:MAG: hypothetical protein ACLQA5_21205 [Solirubrobacteraceae bacterium]